MGLGPNLLTQTDSARHGLQPTCGNCTLDVWYRIIIVLEFTRSDIYFPGHVGWKACLLNWAHPLVCAVATSKQIIWFIFPWLRLTCFSRHLCPAPPERDSSPLIEMTKPSLAKPMGMFSSDQLYNLYFYHEQIPGCLPLLMCCSPPNNLLLLLIACVLSRRSSSKLCY